MNESWRFDKLMVLLAAAIALAPGQTQVDLANQSKNVDFSGANSTKPSKTGTTIPASCSTGEVFFKTNAEAGRNLYGCTAQNTWSQLGPGIAPMAPMASQLGDFSVSNSSTTVQTLGGSCSSLTLTPCQIRTGAVVFALSAPVTLTITGASSSGTVFWYLSSSQMLTAGHNSVATLTCSAGCSVVTGITSFPPDSIPLWQTTFTANVWDGINPATMDKRAFLSRNVIAAGPGVSSVSNPITGIQTLSTDPTQIPRYFVGSGAPSFTCTAGRDFYTDRTNQHLYFCYSLNTWKQADGGGRTDVQNFVLAGFSEPLGGVASAAYTSVAVGTFSATGPNGISYSVAGMPLPVGGAVMVAKKASSTWSGAAGTVDVSILASNGDGAAAPGNWNVNVSVGCAAANGAFSYGTASAISAAPAGLHNFQLYSAAGLNLPGSCAANSPMQFWVQRTADTGGTTGVNPFLVSVEVAMRGN